MSKKSFLVGSAIGAMLGSAAALLLAPQAGKKTQKELKKMARDLSVAVSKRLPAMKKLTREGYEQLVDQSIQEYRKGKKVAERAWGSLRQELLSQWKDVEKMLKSK